MEIVVGLIFGIFIGVVTLAQGTNHTWQGILVILTGVGIIAINLYLLE